MIATVLCCFRSLVVYKEHSNWKWSAGLLQLFAHRHQLWSDAQAAKSSKTRSKVVFRKSRHIHARLLLKALYWLPVKERIICKEFTFVFRFFDGTLTPYLSSCLSVYTPSHTLRSSSDENFLVQDGSVGALVTGPSLFRLPLSGTTFLLTFDTAGLSHSSKLLTSAYSDPLTGIRCCTWLFLIFVLLLTFSLVDWWGGRGGWGRRETGTLRGKGRVVRLCVCVCACEYVCVCVCVCVLAAGESEICNA